MTDVLLKVEDLDVTFAVPKRGAMPWTAPNELQAVKGANLTISRGETLGLVGESGSGKSTLARAIIGTVHPSAGRVLWRGADLTQLSPQARRAHGRHVQMIFQDPLAALNPRMNIGQIIAEPLVTHRPDLDASERRKRVGAMMERVGLLANLQNRYPHEFSGGQCQRIRPELIVFDEAVSALDVSVQAQVVNLLGQLQQEMGLSLLFIAHDLSVVRHVSSRIAVMYLGRLLETGPSDVVTGTPIHPYTRALISSVPIPDPKKERARRQTVLQGEMPSPMNPHSGCVFRTRCPLARHACGYRVPPIEEKEPQHWVACPFSEQEATVNPAHA